MVNNRLNLTILFYLISCVTGLLIPEAKVETMSPRGFRISIPDKDGIKKVDFHGKVKENNSGIIQKGDFLNVIKKATDGRWTFIDTIVKLKAGDTIYYWMSVEYFDGVNTIKYPSDDRAYTVPDQYPPRMVKQPPADEVLFQDDANEPLVIECEAESEPAPTYQWIKNGKPFAWQKHRISQLSGRGTLVIEKPHDEDLGQYQCFAKNDLGTATSNSVFVRKAQLNSFENQLINYVGAYEGEPLKLTCDPPSGWPKPNINWLIQNNDGSLRSINNSRMTLDPEGNLWFAYISKEDMSTENRYVCTAGSKFRKEYKLGNPVMIKVIPAVNPTKHHAPVRQYVTRNNEVAVRGKQVELFCIFSGMPVPQIVWYKNGVPIRPDPNNDRLSQDSYGKKLIIKMVIFEDEGMYTCEASNGVLLDSLTLSYSFKLKVLSNPFFTQGPELLNAADDGGVVIECAAGGEPEPKIKWIHNGVPISRMPTPDPNRTTVSPNAKQIGRIQANDTGIYGCNATNELGYVYKEMYVNENDLMKFLQRRGLENASTPVKVTTQESKPSMRQDPNCPKTETTINNYQRVCGGQLIFNEEFNDFNALKWNQDIRFADKPDYEFVVYLNDTNILQTNGGLLKIKPILLTNKYDDEDFLNQELDLLTACTGIQNTQDCYRQPFRASILPPIASGRINTKNKFSFRYGRVEIRAKLPKGDWIYPELFLQPRENAYGLDYDSGQMRVAYSQGNMADQRKVYSGLILGKTPEARNAFMPDFVNNFEVWSDQFHNYELEWRPTSISLKVDGIHYRDLKPPEGGFKTLGSIYNIMQGSRLWKLGTDMAPFDKEFCFDIGVGVGGEQFPDTGNKPWGRSDPKSTLNFWRDRNSWCPSWNNDSTLQVDHIKVWAL